VKSFGGGGGGAEPLDPDEGGGGTITGTSGGLQVLGSSVRNVSLSMKTAESKMWSPWSKIERKTEWEPGVIGVFVVTRPVAAS
jgi:hypothetical protein